MRGTKFNISYQICNKYNLLRYITSYLIYIYRLGFYTPLNLYGHFMVYRCSLVLNISHTKSTLPGTGRLLGMRI